MPMRLYVAGEGESFRFDTAKSRVAAQRKLGSDVRTPNPDDCRQVWLQGRLYEMTAKEIQDRFHVSRQTVANWRARGGDGLMTASEHKMRVKVEAAQKALTSIEQPSAAQVAAVANLSIKLARQMANKLGVKLRGHRRMPSDEQLIELQRGCTWQELAAKSGMRLSTLRTYIYARPALSEAMRAVRKPAATGPSAHGTFPREKVRELYLKGVTPHVIAEELLVEQMTVRYWINKWRQEEDNAQARDGREVGGSVGGSHEGNQRQPG